jgi:hypothetical protein
MGRLSAVTGAAFLGFVGAIAIGGENGAGAKASGGVFFWGIRLSKKDARQGKDAQMKEGARSSAQSVCEREEASAMQWASGW